jgi:L-cysteine/cystine lyase
MPDEDKLAAVRTGLPATGAGIYLNTGSTGPLPAETARAIAEVEAVELATGRAHPAYVDEMLARMEEARASVAAILGARLDEIALSHATTDGMNIATWAIDWKPGDRAVTTAHEHAGGVGPLYAVRDRVGIEIAFVEPDPDGDDDRTLAAFDAAIRPGTRLVSVSHVLWTTGAVLPVRRIAELARSRGALVAVDGAQAVGAIPFSMADTAADVYAVAGQKWLLGPDGTGAVWCDQRALERMQRTFAGWHSYERIDSHGAAVVHPGARRFQVSGYHQPSIVGLARSCGWLSMFVGLDWIYTRAAALARRARSLLAGTDGVEVLTPEARMGTIVTFRIRGWPAQAALDELGSRVFAIARTVPPLDAIRISVGFFNTDEEVERLVDCVALLAGHSPETVPPRRRLTIVGGER